MVAIKKCVNTKYYMGVKEYHTSFSLDERNGRGDIKTSLAAIGMINSLRKKGYDVQKTHVVMYRDDSSVEGWIDMYDIKMDGEAAMSVKIKELMKDTHRNNLNTTISVVYVDDELDEEFEKMKRKLN